MEKLQKTNNSSSVLEMSLTEFMTEFITSAYRDDSVQLTYKSFYELIHRSKGENIEIENCDFDTLTASNPELANKDYYEEYGLLRACMESENGPGEDVIKISENFMEEYGDYKYAFKMPSNTSGQPNGLHWIIFQFYTKYRISAFIEAFNWFKNGIKAGLIHP